MNLFIEKKVAKSFIHWQSIVDDNVSYQAVKESWSKSNFLFKEEIIEDNIQGLRPPQVGAIHAALGYERSDDKQAATIVMPTGTGKTETILSIVVAGKFPRTLVIVPSDALREQTRDKFVKLGLLRTLGLISDDVENPHVAVIKHGIKNTDELDEILKSNVIIATAASLAQFEERYIKSLINQCSHLIVDEAHHVTAKTWARVKSNFERKPVFQFTATPFRTDKSRIDGKIIFNYPLKQAQEDGYFKLIEFHSVREFVEEDADKVIAEKAIELLKTDLKNGLDHILMARADTIFHAKKVFKLYEGEADLKPILITSKVKNKEAVLESIKNREHRIIVCVGMLGEGFDLPQLKISAIHDIHKSINVMLQFTGRFTRTTKNVGNAKFIANIANPNVNEKLEALYSEDADWNTVISDISANKIHNEKEYQEFKAEFSTPSKLLDLGLNPSISTTVYKVEEEKWIPENFQKLESTSYRVFDSVINDERNMLIFSVKSYLSVGWASSKELFDELWDLYIAFYDKETGLLYIHSSAKDGYVKRLANLIAKNATQLKGELVFRTLAGIKRLKLQNVGLNKNKKGLRYSMHTGTEINDQIPDIEANRATKSNIFGKGFEGGKPVSLGCSYKGKVWAMDSDSLEKWVAWCKRIGDKLLDDNINTNDVLKTAMQTESLKEFPDIRVLSVEWPIDLLRKNESKITISSGKWKAKLIDCELLLSEQQSGDKKTLDIDLATPSEKSQITITIDKSEEMTFDSKEDLDITIGEQTVQLSEYFNTHSPTLFLVDTSVIDNGLRFYSKGDYAYLYEKDNVTAWDWDGIDISVESQTEARLAHSIQYHTIRQIEDGYDVIFDDDGSGEVADIIGIKNIDDEELIIDLFHCKYCSKNKGVAKPGSRVDDVYQVAGQAEKSVKWFSDIDKLLQRLMERERSRLRNHRSTRIDKGRYEDLINLSKVARYAKFNLGINIVQPAISKEKISDDQLAVLGATATYIDEVSGVKLKVISSK
ncbi:DEAD/DEAH box helicase [Parashewanella tropica]|uniref:DEAD/DEAH box helicase n=1 Tax=Parashewanella tropica TaxID=2547970 RepID=UPI00105A830D|nr:DEAD/DEAH box helicase family protein [Parashewanella tropica]